MAMSALYGVGNVLYNSAVWVIPKAVIAYKTGETVVAVRDSYNTCADDSKTISEKVLNVAINAAFIACQAGEAVAVIKGSAKILTFKVAAGALDVTRVAQKEGLGGEALKTAIFRGADCAGLFDYPSGQLAESISYLPSIIELPYAKEFIKGIKIYITQRQKEGKPISITAASFVNAKENLKNPSLWKEIPLGIHSEGVFKEIRCSIDPDRPIFEAMMPKMSGKLTAIYDHKEIAFWLRKTPNKNPPGWPADLPFTHENIIPCPEIQKRIDVEIAIWAIAIEQEMV